MILQANALKIPLADKSVHCCVTSPPYWALRDYGTATWEGGDDKECEHSKPQGAGVETSTLEGGKGNCNNNYVAKFLTICDKCGAKRIDNQIGLEATPEEYLANMVPVFREVWRVMRDDAVLWINLGDSYAAQGNRSGNNGYDDGRKNRSKRFNAPTPTGLKDKDLCMMPARLAIALQADGWWLRSMIPWVKRNPMPESCTDRPTTAIEYVFLLTKKANYFYDAEAVRYEAKYGYSPKPKMFDRVGNSSSQPESTEGQTSGGKDGSGGNRNRRNSDWFFDSWQGLVSDDEGDPMALVVNTYSYKGAHFATFGPKLVAPMIKAGTSEKGCCVECGAPWERVVEIRQEYKDEIKRHYDTWDSGLVGDGIKRQPTKHPSQLPEKNKTIGWQATCKHKAETKPCVVFDPFGGSGTVKEVAEKLGRKAVVMDLSYEYCQLAKKRCVSDQMSLL